MVRRMGTDPLNRLSSVVGIAAGAMVILGSSFAWISGIAWASDIKALEVKHESDMRDMKIFYYEKDIEELTLKPNKTQYDRDRLQLWQSKIRAL